MSWSVNNYRSADSYHYYFDKQKKLLSILKNPYYTIYYSSTRANVYLRSKQYDNAAPLLLECQNVAKKYKLTRTEVYIFNTYLQGVMDLDFKKYDAAIKNFNKEITAAKFINIIIFTDDDIEI
ncbi:MAG: hypothetical protein V4585_22185 [Bacteroidota bacterium]